MASVISRGILKPSTTSLFVCDVQEKFRKIIHEYPSVIEMSRYMLEGANALNIPTVLTEQVPDKLGVTCEELQPHIPTSARNFPKTRFSMMTPDVKEHLKTQLPEVKQILLCGIEAHVCVTQTALDLLADGYEVHLIVDAISSSRAPDREIALQRMSQAGAFLCSAEMAMFQLCGDAKSEHFKAISKLAKQPKAHTQLGLRSHM
mmetsp:Transcript_7087/g.8167  ORF Transcript_7087/g.8167 Transcript_7087/m.8167 type:complete len:204 (-) Transcript_7087:379-990(-)